ncbi:MAG: peptidoglycan bridge formation glycyltransferase FemA/FemB family protein [Bifidobacteriaceae bacterium]|jgi:lipid II:glycine glycyltransferase (peptidoglycan interpeptide bridge formation enzyme)|nr:peptidoglycan bridge formation glycyltransferase FemA/FemB family protein [Bifidobacteriaceae bacterium]
MVKFLTQEDAKLWNKFVNSNNGHPLQLWQWGDLKSEFDWEATRVQIYKTNRKNAPVIGGFQILKRHLPKPFKATYYIPRGPIVVGEENQLKVFEALKEYTEKNLKKTGVLLQIEPALEKIDDAIDLGKRAKDTNLLPETVILDLTKTEDELFRSMTKKTRWNINRSQRNDIEIVEAKNEADVEACYNVYKSTADEDDFGIHTLEYYQAVFRVLGKFNRVYMVKFQNKVIAFLWNLENKNLSFELYAGATQLGYDMRVNYALKWHAIRQAQAHKVAAYDLNGLLNDGISHFKLGFSSGKRVRFIGTYERSLSSLSKLYKIALPVAKRIMI